MPDNEVASRRSRQATIGLVITAGAAAVYLFAFYASGLARTPAQSSQFETGMLSDGSVVSQTFRVRANGLRAVTLYPRPATLVAGEIRMVLHRGMSAKDDIRVVREQTVPALEFARRPSWTFAFAPVEDSYDGFFRLDLLPGGGSRGVRLLAVAGDTYREGTMLLNERSVPADLKFETSAARASPVSRVAARFGDDARARMLLVIAGLLTAAGWLLLLFSIVTSYSPEP